MQPLTEAGLASLGAVELSNGISSAFGINLPPTFMFDYPSINAMAAYISSTSGQAVAVPTSSIVTASDLCHAAMSAQAVTQNHDRVSYLAGVAGRYPGATEGQAGFWRTITGHGDVQGVVPPERWEIDAVYVPEAIPGRVLQYTR